MRAERARRSLVWILPFLPLMSGCIGENEAVVFVEPSIENPSAAVSSSALGTSLSGAFRLLLVLGPRASGPSKVSLIQFSIASADETTQVVPSLEAASPTSFPVTVGLDSEVRVDFTFDTGATPLPADTEPALCASPGIKITGTLQDSLQGGATPVASAVFAPSGCM